MFGTAFAQTPAPAAPAAGGGLNSILGFLPIILIFAVLYFLMILPQQRRQKKHTQMLERGDRVVLGSGIHGIVSNVKEQTFLVKIAESTEIEVDKSAVSYKFGAEK
jgi:preprotein translocase subunit YajC